MSTLLELTRHAIRSMVFLTFMAAQAISGFAADDTPDPVGRPKQFVQGKKAFGVWFEDGQWKLRTTAGKARVVFTGTVTVIGDRLTGDFTALEKSKKAATADFFQLEKGNTVLTFRFSTAGATDGVDFKVGPKAKSVTFKLKVGEDDDPRMIWIGAKGAHPAKAEFTLPAHPGK